LENSNWDLGNLRLIALSRDTNSPSDRSVTVEAELFRKNLNSTTPRRLGVVGICANRQNRGHDFEHSEHNSDSMPFSSKGFLRPVDDFDGSALAAADAKAWRYLAFANSRAILRRYAPGDTPW